MELDTVTDSTTPDPQESGSHRVTFAQECLITVTNSRSDRIGLEMEILSLAMERAKGTQVAMSFDSEQGGETADDVGYIPVLKKMVGGHLRFLISPDGKMLRAEGIPEWLGSALGDAPVRIAAPKVLLDTSAKTLPPTNNVSALTNALGNVIRKVGRNMSAPPAASAMASRRSTVSTTLRNFFTPELFRQMLEFKFLPPAPVRVGEEWNKQGDLALNARIQFKFNAVGKFPGWQKHGDTNCARIDAHGMLMPPNSPSPAAASASSKKEKDNLTATVWIDPQLNFPVTTVWDTQSALPNQTTVRKTGTNNVATVVTNGLPRSVHQNVSITLLEANPVETATAQASLPSP